MTTLAAPPPAVGGPPAPGDEPPDTASPPRLLARRYQLVSELGSGGAGAVYRVLDRLAGRIVALKRLKSVDAAWADLDSHQVLADRLALAQEFRLLAACRHPHVISVLDYGFDDQQRPYYTMDYLEGARTLIEAGRDQPLAAQVDLVVQALRALAYLHRRGIIHRDLKPANILVQDQVKVLDFGLSVQRGAEAAERRQSVGTLPYMAPEVLRGEPAGERSDLYALGLVAYELFAGAHPLMGLGAGPLQLRILREPVPLEPLQAHAPALVPVLARLLSVDPAARFAHAEEVVAAFAEALGHPLLVETPATRESFLQAARFVGRDTELGRLAGVLERAGRGRGGAWLIGGESGAGKSRLLDEVRTLALVRGLLVVRGHAVMHGGRPYEAWRDVARSLALQVDLDDREAGVLRTLVPDIDALLGRAVPEPPVVDAEATRARLFSTMEAVLRRVGRPVAVVLEDLHWAGAESLAMFDWLTATAREAPVFLLGSYRDDEQPDLPGAVPGAEVFALGRLLHSDVALLTESMVGARAARRPGLVDLVARETEGIPFFVVEVVRALAETAGGLDRLHEADLPTRVVSGGMQRLVQRRLDRLDADALPPLSTMAVVGRELEPELLAALYPGLDLEGWLTHCGAVAVLEAADGRWRFAHDKLRERLLAQLDEAALRAVHRRVAEGLEVVHPERVAALAWHWARAGDRERELTYTEAAGLQALRSGAFDQARLLLVRAVELAGEEPPRPWPARGGLRDRLDLNRRVDPDCAAFRRGRLQAALTEASYHLGEMQACRRHGELALRSLGQHVPTTAAGWTLSLLGQLLRRLAQAALRVRSSDPERAARVAHEVGAVQLRFCEACYYSLDAVAVGWATLRLMNHCQPVPPSSYLAHGNMLMSLLAGAVPAHGLAQRWGRRALEVAEAAGTDEDRAYMLSRVGVYQLGACLWEGAGEGLRRALQLAEDVGNRRLWEECHSQLGMLSLFTGRYAAGLWSWDRARESAERRGNRQIACWGLMGRADHLVRLGHHAEAIELYDRAAAAIDPVAMRTETIWCLGMRALARLHRGDHPGAWEDATRGLAVVTAAGRPVAYWTQHGTAAVAEVLLALLTGGAGLAVDREERLLRAREAVRGVRMHAGPFRLSRPFALLWRGVLADALGRRARAERYWRRCVRLARRLGTPYELARAELLLAGEAAEPSV